MNLEQSLATRLLAYSGLTALVSTRVYPLWLPQETTLDAVTYRLIAATPEPEFNLPSGLVTALVSISSWGIGTSSQSAYAAAKALAIQVRACLDGFCGQLGGTGGVQAFISWANEAVLYDPDTGRVQVIDDFQIAYQV